MAYCFLRREGLCLSLRSLWLRTYEDEAESTSGHSEREMQRWRNVQETVMMPMASWMCSEGVE
jgi:hypothetical protein